MDQLSPVYVNSLCVLDGGAAVYCAAETMDGSTLYSKREADATNQRAHPAYFSLGGACTFLRTFRD